MNSYAQNDLSAVDRSNLTFTTDFFQNDCRELCSETFSISSRCTDCDSSRQYSSNQYLKPVSIKSSTFTPNKQLQESFFLLKKLTLTWFDDAGLQNYFQHHSFYQSFRKFSMGMSNLANIFVFIFFILSFFTPAHGVSLRNRNNNSLARSLLVNSTLSPLPTTNENVPILLKSVSSSLLSSDTVASVDHEEVSSTPVTKTSGRKRKQKGRKTKRKKKNKKRKRNKKVRQRKVRKTESDIMQPSLPSTLMIKPGGKNRKSLSIPRRDRLYNKIGNSFHLAVTKKRVLGEPAQKKSEFSILEIRGVGEKGTVTIKGVAANKFICVSKKGVVKPKKKYRKSQCRFYEKILENKQNSYESLSCEGCYLNINRKGKVKRLRGVKPNLTQAHFLPLPVENSLQASFLASKRGKVVTVDLSRFNGTDVTPKNLQSLFKYEIKNAKDVSLKSKSKFEKNKGKARLGGKKDSTAAKAFKFPKPVHDIEQVKM